VARKAHTDEGPGFAAALCHGAKTGLQQGLQVADQHCGSRRWLLLAKGKLIFD
jgi:hypothetical protein